VQLAAGLLLRHAQLLGQGQRRDAAGPAVGLGARLWRSAAHRPATRAARLARHGTSLALLENTRVGSCRSGRDRELCAGAGRRHAHGSVRQADRGPGTLPPSVSGGTRASRLFRFRSRSERRARASSLLSPRTPASMPGMAAPRCVAAAQRGVDANDGKRSNRAGPRTSPGSFKRARPRSGFCSRARGRASTARLALGIADRPRHAWRWHGALAPGSAARLRRRRQRRGRP
jgi:hypothetical protein